jgi:hypothetical protein
LRYSYFEWKKTWNHSDFFGSWQLYRLAAGSVLAITATSLEATVVGTYCHTSLHKLVRMTVTSLEVGNQLGGKFPPAIGLSWNHSDFLGSWKGSWQQNATPAFLKKRCILGITGTSLEVGKGREGKLVKTWIQGLPCK